MQGRNSSEDFFSQTAAASSSTTNRRRPAAPANRRMPTAARPPPPGGSASSSTTSNSTAAQRSSYYGTTGTKPNASASNTRTNPSTTTTTAATSSSSSSYYGTNTGGAPAPYASTAASASTRNTAATTTTNNDGWYTAPAPAAAATNPYLLQQPTLQQQAPQQQQQQQQQPSPSFSYTPAPAVAPQQPSQFMGSMDLSGPMNTSTTAAPVSTFVPQAPTSHRSSTSSSIPEEDYENEPPLLEELGIRLDHIVIKTRAVILPFKKLDSSFGSSMEETTQELMQTADLAGPLAFALGLGGEMLLMGKLQFGYIYGFGVFGCLCMTLVLNLMKTPTTAPAAVATHNHQPPNEDKVSFWVVTSILGYALLPVNLFALLKIVLSDLVKLQTLSKCLGLVTIAWCTVASTRLLEQGYDMRHQRYLIAYPIALLYSAFVLITVF